MDSYLESITKQFLYYKKLGEQAMLQIDDDGLLWQFNPESNSIAMIVNHLAGNMLSRFTDFLNSDGEKPWRNRDKEFEALLKSRQEITDYWEKGWDCLFKAIAGLSEKDLDKIVYIRNEGHTVIEALNRQLAHYPYHIGQMIYIAKMLKDADWKTLSIARNKSSDYNARKFASEKGKRHFTDDV